MRRGGEEKHKWQDNPPVSDLTANSATDLAQYRAERFSKVERTRRRAKNKAQRQARRQSRA